jgi:outer membrane protein TolC
MVFPYVLLTVTLTAGVPADSVLTLAALERAVLVQNPTLESMRAAWQEAVAQARQAGALDDPMLDVMAAPASFAGASTDPAYRIQVLQRIPLFGRRDTRRTAADAETRAALGDAWATRLDLLHETRSAFYEDFAIARAIAANHDAREVADALRRSALHRYAVGSVGATDPLQAETELAMLDHDRIVLERRRRIVVAQINALLHQPADAPLPAPPYDLPIPPPAPPRKEAPRGEDLRPELRAADARVDAARAQLRLARRQRLPEPAVGAAYDRFWSEGPLRTSVMVSLNLPIWTGRLAASEREARFRLAGAEAERAALRDRIAREIAEADARLYETQHEIAILRDVVLPAAERTLRSARAEYETGTSDLTAFLTASRNLLRVRVEFSDALASFYQAQGDLDRATGADAPAALAEVQP